MSAIEARLQALGIALPAPLVLPSRNRTAAVMMGEALYLSGHGAALLEDPALKRRGKVGVGLSEEEAESVARALAIKMLATIKAEIGDLDRVRKVVKITGFINAPPDFERPNRVLNGASDLFFEVFGEAVGRHARSSLVVAGLVDDQPVEIEGVFWVRP